MVPMKSNLFLVLALILGLLPGVFSMSFCFGAKDFAMMNVYVDTFAASDTNGDMQYVLATSDGGAALIVKRKDTGALRVIKVNVDAKYEWYSEHSVDGATGGSYSPQGAAEDRTDAGNVYLFVAGIHDSTRSFVIKYKMLDGSYVSSRLFTTTIASYTLAKIKDILVDSSGILVFAGTCCTSLGACRPWLGKIDSSTLAMTDHSVISSINTDGEIHRMLEDGGYYVVAGVLNTGLSVWVAKVLKSTWAIDVEWVGTATTTANTVLRLLLSMTSGNYKIQDSNWRLFDIKTASGFSSPTSLPSTYEYTTSLITSTVIIATADPQDATNYMLCYYYDLATDCLFVVGSQPINAPGFSASYTDRNPAYSHVWTAGATDQTNHGTLLKFAIVTAVTCGSGEVSYRNQCYAKLYTGCFGLCSSCLIANDQNACTGAGAGSDYYCIGLFAGRCDPTAKAYQYSTGTCETILQSSACHPLCGGECLALGDATKCTIHCSSRAVDPYIDDSAIAQNTCQCAAVTTYSTTYQRCAFTSNCYVLCGNSECGEINDNAKCFACVSGDNIVATVSGAYTKCVCAPNSLLVGSACLACHIYCSGCTVPADNTKCLACASITNIVQTGAASPYACASPVNSVYSAALSAFLPCHDYCSGCTVTADNTKCLACGAITGIVQTGAISPYTCACPDNYMYNSATSSCLLCHVFCSGCTTSSDPTQCSDCAAITNILKTGTVAPYTCACPTNYVYVSGSSACLPCHALCNECSVPSDSTKCTDCSTGAGVIKTGTSAPYTCACATHTTVSGSACLECDAFCGECTVPADSTKCVDCAAITNIVLTGSTCACPNNHVYIGASTSCLPCHTFCNGCSATADNTQCSACASITNIVQTGTAAPYTCACPVNAIYVIASTACLSCYPLCNGCSVSGDQSQCLDCATGTDIVKTGSVAPYTCACAAGTVLSGTSCLPCHAYCNGCTVPSDNTKCSACAGITDIIQTGAASPYTCACPAGYVYIAASTACLPCHKYCNGCTASADSTKCLACAAITAIVKVGTVSPYTCDCPANYMFSEPLSACLACHVLCIGCSVTADNAQCLDCVATANVVKTGSSAPYTCTCASGTVLSGTGCLACSPFCDQCTAPADNTKCVACATITDIVQTGAASPYTCTCPVGTTLSIATSSCSLCSPLCNGCTEPADNTKCEDCATISGIVKTGASSPFTCACPVNTAVSGTACTVCHNLCSGCTVPMDNTKCLACVAVTDIVQTGAAAPYTCACADNYVLSGTACVSCHSFCNGCTLPADNSKCIDCAAITNIQKSGTFAPYTCDCPSASVLVGTACLSCHTFCGSCTVPADNTKCLTCAAIPNILKTGAVSPYTCACPSGYVYASDSLSCIICSNFCNECTAPEDNTKCVDCAAFAGISKTGSSVPYTCGCPSGTVLSGAACLACHSFCSECTIPADNTRCLACAAITNIAQSGTGPYYTCACPSGTALSGSACLLCSTFCNGCTVPGDNTKCLDCAVITGVLKTGASAPYTCACPSNYLLVGTACLACDSRCSGCLSPADNGQCLDCAAITGVLKTGGAAPYTCSCPSGTVLSGSACLACDPLCDGCTVPGDNTKCLACAAATGVVQTGAVSPYTCACPSNTALSGSACLPCHTFCSGCTIPSDNTKCLACALITDIQMSGASSPYTCACPTNYILVGSACLVCNSYCNGCTVPADNTKCLDCAAITAISKTGSSPYTCACPSGTVLSGTSCSACSAFCTECTAPGDNTKCVACAAITGVVMTGASSPYICDCPIGTALSGTSCVPCHSFCNGCTAPGDNTKCLACAAITGVEKTGTVAPYKCACPNNYVLIGASCLACNYLCNGCTLDSDNTKCLDCASIASVVKTGASSPYTCSCASHTVLYSGQCQACSPYCSECTVPGDHTKCLDCAAITGIQKTGTVSPYTCTCSPNTALSGTACLPCHAACSDCLVPGDNTQCWNCAPIANIVWIGGAIPYTCACAFNYVLVGTVCLLCHPLCGGCTVPGDNTACSACAVGANIVTYGTASPYTCACAFGTILSGSECLPCHGLCSGCTVPGDNTKCLNCAAVTDVIKTGTAAPYTCSCPPHNALSGTSCLGCHQFCSECTMAGDNTKCINCAAITGITRTGTAVPYTCGCPDNSLFDGTTCFECHPLCSGCTVPGDNTKCAACASTGHVEMTGTVSPYICTCTSGTALYEKTCQTCHPLCNECTVPNDNSRCLSCINTLNLLSTEDHDTQLYTCECLTSTTYIDGVCAYTSGCHALCGGQACGALNDYTVCAFSCSPGTVTTPSPYPNLYSCTCPTGQSFNGTGCITIFTENCYGLCKTACFAIENKQQCVDCRTGLNIVTSLTSPSTAAYTCSCTSGTQLVDLQCVYTSNCHKYCAKNCFSQANNTACVSCAKGITAVWNSDGSATCECPKGTVYYNESCVSLLNSTSVSSCYALCGEATCIVYNNASMCVGSCKNSTNVVAKASTDDAIECGCASGTHLNSIFECVLDVGCGALCDNCKDSDTCLSCPAGKEGMTITGGTCVCEDGYVLATNEDTDGVYGCVADSTTATDVISVVG